MTQTTDFKPPPAVSTEASVSDRRRPGRVNNVSPELIPLLRSQPAEPASDAPPQFGDHDQLGAVRGIAIGAALSAPLWVGIALLGRWILS